MLVASKKRRTKKLIIIFAIALLVALFFNFYLVKKIFGPSTSEEVTKQYPGREDKLISDWEKVYLKLFENELFVKLKKYGNWPVEVKVKGRANPFLKPQSYETD